MTKQARITALVGAAAICGAAIVAVAPAQALTSQQCSAKYQAAKTAGTLNGQSWQDFRKAECGADAATTPAASPAEPKEAQAKPSADKPSADKPVADKPVADKPANKPAATPAAPATAAVFPSTVDAKYAKETASRARLHTCADQWKLNKASNATGGLRWIQKGGGYWSECNKKLKGA
ncbi:hypothetical protein HNR60_004168 [Rhodopseudomonas rhenobacensis]|uniref:Uncharacterized protein n=1 Tax=Rhodopseudomonas rhenobacensis TaxID=87461 RepID=A0A7W7Z7E2_9BRAD|nr:hypothetical protein [Rhodopseudomonas rhenobacensis]MBB5049391.1 hypothetical protein [Rhodopseudomonas rhenobacensis]